MSSCLLSSSAHWWWWCVPRHSPFSEAAGGRAWEKTLSSWSEFLRGRAGSRPALRKLAISVLMLGHWEVAGIENWKGSETFTEIYIHLRHCGNCEMGTFVYSAHFIDRALPHWARSCCTLACSLLGVIIQLEQCFGKASQCCANCCKFSHFRGIHPPVTSFVVSFAFLNTQLFD